MIHLCSKFRCRKVFIINNRVLSPGGATSPPALSTAPSPPPASCEVGFGVGNVSEAVWGDVLRFDGNVLENTRNVETNIRDNPGGATSPRAPSTARSPPTAHWRVGSGVENVSGVVLRAVGNVPEIVSRGFMETDWIFLEIWK